MINLDYITLNKFFEENIDFFIGSRLQKIQQPTRRDFILSLRNNGESRKLYININPQTYHICFMTKEGEERRNIQIPSHPPMFCMLLRKYLEGAKVSDALTVENERIFELHFETYDELSQLRSLCLAVELMGKHSNIILYDRETSIILGCAHNIGSEKSKYRELQGGLKYIYPPKVNERSNIETPLFQILGNEYPNISLSNALDNYYSKIQEGVNVKSEKSKLLNITESKLKKVKNSVSKIKTLLKKRDNTEKYKHLGDLLTANLYLKADYKTAVEVLDYTTGEKIEIELDPTKTMNENAQRYYKLYNKSKTTKEKSSQLLEGLNIEREYMENIIYSIDKADSLKDLDEIKLELGIIETKKPDKKQPLTVTKLELDGFEVYIGKNNKQNDYIVSKLAKDNDYWFHTRLCAGSHVLLKVKEKEPDERILFECCKLAREYSSASQPSKVGVIYTRAKFLRKPPAAPLGYVTYKNEKEVLI